MTTLFCPCGGECHHPENLCDPCREAKTHAPGENHTYEIRCTICGEYGMFFFAINPQTAEVEDAPSE